MRISLAILFCTILTLFLNNASRAQVKKDTLRFTLFYSENRAEAEEEVIDQLDSVLNKAGFSDLEFGIRITSLVVYGHTDNKGSKKSNQRLSEERAGNIREYLAGKYVIVNAIVTGFGQTKPIASNNTPEGKARNRRVELYIAYEQRKLGKSPVPSATIEQDTVIQFEDGSKLKINLLDFKKVGKCITYQKKDKLIDVFQDLAIDQQEGKYFIFGKVTLHWCTSECLNYPITLSIAIPDSIVKEFKKDIKNFLKHLKERATLQKHKDNLWYLDVVTQCPLELRAFCMPCGYHGKARIKYKRVKFVAKDGYRFVAASIGEGQYKYFKPIKHPVRKIKFRISCPYNLPELSVVAIKNGKTDTLYFASNTEKVIEYRRRCLNCKDKTRKIDGFLGIQVHPRLLRRKYIFRSKDYERRLNLKTEAGKRY